MEVFLTLNIYPKKLNTRNCYLLRVSLYCATFTFTSLSLAAENPDTFTFTASAGVNHDSNLFRSASNEQSETIRQLSAGVNANIPVSLQRFIFNASIDDNRYQHFDHLNYKGGRGKADWAWKVGDRASGDLGYQYEQVIADFGDIQSRNRDLVTQKLPFFGINYLVTPNWQAVGKLSRAEIEHSDSTRQSLNHDINSTAIGFNYLSGPDNSIGFLATRNDSKYPQSQAVSVLDINGVSIASVSAINNSYIEEEYSTVVNWAVTGVSRFIGRVGYTNRDQKEMPSLSFSGGTGRLTYRWSPTGISSIDFTGYREINSSDDLSATHIVSRGFSIAPKWSPTDFLRIQLRALRETRTYGGNAVFATATTQQRKDSYWSTQISANYVPVRNVELSLALERGKRNSNVENFDYKYNLIMAKGKITF